MDVRIGMGAADMSCRDALERQRSALAIAASNAVAGNNYFIEIITGLLE